MSIIGSLPNNLANGTNADASQVMADLNFIVNQVNANASPLGTLTAPTGTRMLFHQASAPLGWVTDTSINDHGMVVSSNGGVVSSSGSGYTGFMNGLWTSGNHTLVVSEIPSHVHGVQLVVGSGVQSGAAQQSGASFGAVESTDIGNGGNGPHSHPMNTNWKYVSCLVAQKS